MKTILIALAVLLLPLILVADDSPKPPMRSAAAVAAVKKHDLAADKAVADYSRAMLAAEKQLITDLDTAEKVATKAESLDEALSIRAAKKDAESRLAEIPKAPDAHTSMNRQMQNALAQRLANTKWSSGNGGQMIFLSDGAIDDGSFVGRWSPIAENTVIGLFKANDGEFVNLYRFDPALTNFKSIHGHLGDMWESKRLP